MRIVAKVHNYPPRHNAGAEWMIHPMLAALAKRGHRVEVHLSRHIPGDQARKSWKLDDVYVYPLGAVGRTDRRPDIYLTHLDCIRPVSAAARGLGVPLVVVQHNTLDTDIKNIKAARPDLIVHNSEWMRDWMTEHDYVYPGIVCHPPVDAERYKADKPGDKVTLINLTGGKGASLLWDLARRMPDTQFLACEGNYGGQIIQDLPNVEVVGPFDGRVMRDEVYGKTRVLLVPSYYESWGRVATEAMCNGIPVIAHRAIGAMHENLGDSAIWCDRDKPEEWVREIKRLSKPAEYAKASQAASDQFASFDFDAEVSAFCDAVEDLGGVPHPMPSQVITTHKIETLTPAPPVEEPPVKRPATTRAAKPKAAAAASDGQ